MDTRSKTRIVCKIVICINLTFLIEIFCSVYPWAPLSSKFARIHKTVIITKMVNDQKLKEFDFEQSLRALETLVSESENGNVRLEDMVKNYEQGIKIVANCRKKLELAELQIQEASNSKSNPTKQDA